MKNNHRIAKSIKIAINKSTSAYLNIQSTPFTSTNNLHFLTGTNETKYFHFSVAYKRSFAMNSECTTKREERTDGHLFTCTDRCNVY